MPTKYLTFLDVEADHILNVVPMTEARFVPGVGETIFCLAVQMRMAPSTRSWRYAIPSSTPRKPLCLLEQRLKRSQSR